MSQYSQFMTMRAMVRRNTSGKDDYGHQKPAGFEMVQDSVPCYVWISQTKEFVDAKEVVVEVVKGYFRAGIDLQRDDQIVEVKDRRGRVVMAGPLVVDSLNEKSQGASPSHVEVLLRRHRG